MRDSDERALLVVIGLGAAVAAAWFISLPRGLGVPGLGSGVDRGGPEGLRADWSDTRRKPLVRIPKEDNQRAGGGARARPGKKPGLPVVDVYNPRVVTPEEYKRQHKRRPP